MNWATAAAFTAAFLSLVNVGYSYSLTSRGSREQWRREQERPIVAKILTLSNDITEGWLKVHQARSKPGAQWPDPAVQAAWDKTWDLWRDLNYQVAQLDLLASTPVRDVARPLSRAHEALGGISLMDPVTESSTDFGEVGSEPVLDVFQASLERIPALEAALVDAARTDLGLGPVVRVQVPLPSEIGKRVWLPWPPRPRYRRRSPGAGSYGP